MDFCNKSVLTKQEPIEKFARLIEFIANEVDSTSIRGRIIFLNIINARRRLLIKRIFQLMFENWSGFFFKKNLFRTYSF